MSNHRTYLEHDWYKGGIPGNVVVGEDVYIDSSYAFASFFSQRTPGLTLGHASGVYDCTAFIVGPAGMVSVGPFTCLNGTYLICNKYITIGAHCLLAWGVVIADTWVGKNPLIAKRRTAIEAATKDPERRLPPAFTPRPVVLEDNVWVGFDAVILPGVTLKRGCIVGSKAVISEDVPSYAVVVGNPPRVVRYLDPVDTEEARQQALKEYTRA